MFSNIRVLLRSEKMNVYSKHIRIIILGVVLTICIVGGTMAFQSDAKSTINQSLTNLPSYPENENGQTYGSANETTSVEMQPDLIFSGSVNGIAGYLLKKIILVNLVVMSNYMMLME